jgi:hypothetical protein
MSRSAKFQEEIDVRVETLKLRILVHGPSAALDEEELLRQLHANEYSVWMGIAQVLRDVGMAEQDIWMIVNVRHPPGCCCWPCVGKLHAWVWKTTQARLARLDSTKA